MEKNTVVLGIETSCDETSVAVVRNGHEVLSNVIFSQISTHKKFGGVVPEIASRMHLDVIDLVFNEALEKAGMGIADIDVFAVTNGPGLVGALLTGLSFAKGIAFAQGKPLVAVNHIKGHIASNYLGNDAIKPPYICMVVSGGHTTLLKVLDYNLFEEIGKTRDDAAGEAFDKVARTLDLPYPGGPEIEKISKLGSGDAIKFPKSFTGDHNYDFSFSGLKSSVLNFVNQKKQKSEPFDRCDVAASFQKSLVDVLIEKSKNACLNHALPKLAVAGGVSANSSLRIGLKKMAAENDIVLKISDLAYCTDNAAMIASAGYFLFQANEIAGFATNAVPNLSI